MKPRFNYFSTELVSHDLKGRTVRGGAWTAIAQGCNMVIQLATIPLLARPLEQSDFGLVGMAAVFTGFASMFVDAGMSMATVQRKEITHAQVSNLFWLSSVLGLAMALVSAASAPLVAWFFNRAELVPLVVALGVPFLFAGMTTQHRALLTRAMRFRQLAIVQVLSALIARTLAVYLAWRYHTYWALAAGQIAQPVLAFLLTWALSGWRPGLPRRGTGVRPLVAFGANLTGFNTINYFARNADNLLIGKVWGAGQLGAYDQAYKLFMMPMRRIKGPLGTVAVPALSRLVDEPARYRAFYLAMVRKLALAIVPVAMFLIAAADLFVPGYLGPGWEESIPILRALALAGIVQAVGTTTGWLYVTHGRADQMLRVALLVVPVLILAFLSGLPWGAVGVSYAYAAAVLLIVFPLQTTLACRETPIRPRDLLLALAAPIGVGGFVIAGSLFSRLVLGGQSPEAALIIAVVCSVAAGGVGLVVIPNARSELHSLVSLARHILGKPTAAPRSTDGAS